MQFQDAGLGFAAGESGSIAIPLVNNSLEYCRISNLDASENFIIGTVGDIDRRLADQVYRN